MGLPAEHTQGQLVEQPSNTVSMFERLAKDPSVDVAKLERLMDLKERADARTAEQLFNAAMTDAQTEMRQIGTDSDNSQTKSKYASYSALDKALRPLYTKHGFALSFGTGDGPAEHVRVVCHVSHRAGHSRDYKIDMPADGKGAKGGDVMTKTHATGSATSYGMRYLLKMIFNVAIGEDDDDGNGATAIERITFDEVMNLTSLLDGISPKGVDEKWTKAARVETERRFLKYLSDFAKVKIQRLEEIPAKVYPEALAQIKARKK